MKSATELLQAYIEGPHDAETVVTLFAEDGVLEAPYFASLAMPWRFVGHEALLGTYDHLTHLYPDLRFENLRVIHGGEDLAVGEYEFIATSERTGRRVHQLSIVTIVAKNGQIALLREFQNIAEIALAIFPNGLADVGIAEDRALSIGAFSGQA